MEDFVNAIKKLLKNASSVLGLVLMLFFVFVAIMAPILAPPTSSNPYQLPRSGWSAVPQPPSLEAPFGTTEGQYDIYYGIVWGTRTVFKIGLIVIGAAVAIGLLVGTLAAYFGGWIDEILMRISDIFLAFPFLIGVIVLVTIFGPDLNNVIIALIIFYWMGYARLIRGSVLQIRENQYIMAAVSLGSPGYVIIFRHLLPNAIYPVIIKASMDMAVIPLMAAALSFLGLGSPMGYADWGQLVAFSRNWIISSNGVNPFAFWYTIFFPAITIILYALGWNLIGDALRDILDPKMVI